MMSFHPFPQLKTKRLVLRQAISTDGKSVFALRSDPKVNQYVNRSCPKDLDEAIAFIEKVNQNRLEEKAIYWAIADQKHPQMIGSICLWNFSEDRKTAEVGYDLLPQNHQQGIMSEALQAVLRFGFDQLHLQSIEAYTHRDNLASTNLLGKAGFQLTPNKTDADNSNNIVFHITK